MPTSAPDSQVWRKREPQAAEQEMLAPGEGETPAITRVLPSQPRCSSPASPGTAPCPAKHGRLSGRAKEYRRGIPFHRTRIVFALKPSHPNSSVSEQSQWAKLS